MRWPSGSAEWEDMVPKRGLDGEEMIQTDDSGKLAGSLPSVLSNRPHMTSYHLSTLDLCLGPGSVSPCHGLLWYPIKASVILPLGGVCLGLWQGSRAVGNHSTLGPGQGEGNSRDYSVADLDFNSGVFCLSPRCFNALAIHPHFTFLLHS